MANIRGILKSNKCLDRWIGAWFMFVESILNILTLGFFNIRTYSRYLEWKYNLNKR